MSGRTRLILTAVAAFLVVLLFFLFAIRPRKADLSDLQVQVQQEDQRTTALNLELEHLKDLQANAPKAEAELAKIKQFIPEQNEVDNFVFQVNTAADEAGVRFVQVTPTLPKTPPEGAAVAEVPVQLGAEGGYFAVQDFVRRLYDLDRALRIDTVTIGTEEENDITHPTLLITARIFFELPESAGTTTGVIPAPGVTPTPTPVP